MTNWIKCSERLPEDNVDVLLFNRMGICHIGYLSSKTKKWSLPSYSIADITHWQPLPKAPNED